MPARQVGDTRRAETPAGALHALGRRAWRRQAAGQARPSRAGHASASGMGGTEARPAPAVWPARRPGQRQGACRRGGLRPRAGRRAGQASASGRAGPQASASGLACAQASASGMAGVEARPVPAGVRARRPDGWQELRRGQRHRARRPGQRACRLAGQRQRAGRRAGGQASASGTAGAQARPPGAGLGERPLAKAWPARRNALWRWPGLRASCCCRRLLGCQPAGLRACWRWHGLRACQPAGAGLRACTPAGAGLRARSWPARPLALGSAHGIPLALACEPGHGLHARWRWAPRMAYHWPASLHARWPGLRARCRWPCLRACEPTRPPAHWRWPAFPLALASSVRLPYRCRWPGAFDLWRWHAPRACMPYGAGWLAGAAASPQRPGRGSAPDGAFFSFLPWKGKS